MYKKQLNKAYFPAQYDMEIIDLPIGRLLNQVAMGKTNRSALTEIKQDGTYGRHWNYAQLWNDSERLALALSTRFSRGEKVVVWSPNSPE